MMKTQCWVELEVFFDQDPRVIRIFKSKSQAMDAWNNIRGSGIGIMDRGEAVKSIRKQIFYRSKGFCELCGEIVLETSGHMHEKQHRGKGGEISLENSIFICAKCHQDAHKDRAPRFTKKGLTSE